MSGNQFAHFIYFYYPDCGNPVVREATLIGDVLVGAPGITRIMRTVATRWCGKLR